MNSIFILPFELLFSATHSSKLIICQTLEQGKLRCKCIFNQAKINTTLLSFFQHTNLIIILAFEFITVTAPSSNPIICQTLREGKLRSKLMTILKQSKINAILLSFFQSTNLIINLAFELVFLAVPSSNPIICQTLR